MAFAVSLLIVGVLLPSLSGNVYAKSGKERTPRDEKTRNLDLRSTSSVKKTKKIAQTKVVKKQGKQKKAYPNWNDYSEIKINEYCWLEDFRVNKDCMDTVDLAGQ